MKYATRLFKEEDGQAMTEYGLLVGLIAMAVVAALLLLGPAIAKLFTDIATRLGAIPIPA